jgi:hypothetical protein
MNAVPDRKIESLSIRDYLLGESTPTATEAIELEMLSNPEFVQMVSITEDELIEEYLTGHLNRKERELFVTSFLASPKRRADFEFSVALQARIASGFTTEPDSFWQRIAKPFALLRAPSAPTIALASLMFLLAALALVRDVRTRHERSELVAKLAEAESKLRVKGTVAPHAPSHPVTTEASTMAVSLFPVTSRGRADAVTISVAAPVRLVRLELPVLASFPSFSVALIEGSTRKLVWIQHDLTALDGVIPVEIPASTLKSQDYDLQLTGVQGRKTEESATYRFKVRLEQ